MLNSISEKYSNRTRVLITGHHNEDILFHILSYHGKDADKAGEESTHSDFVVKTLRDSESAAGFYPNILLLSKDREKTNDKKLLDEITGGGVLIYPENDTDLNTTVNQAQNYFRKLSYTPAEFEEKEGCFIVKSEFGELPVSVQDEASIQDLEGIRLLCQQFGIMEGDFYEAVMNLSY